jgi:hypothetical protein
MVIFTLLKSDCKYHMTFTEATKMKKRELRGLIRIKGAADS